MSRVATPCDLISEPHCVLGTMLRPFSLGHHLLLARIGSPFEANAAVYAPPEQLALAVFICATSYADTIAAMHRGEWEAENRRWTKALKPRWWQRTRFRQDDEAEKFSRYLAAGYRKPPLWKHGGNGLELSAPWECLLLARLVQGGFSAAEVLEQYLPASWYHYHTFRELQQADHYHPKQGVWNRVFWTEIDAARYSRAGGVN